MFFFGLPPIPGKLSALFDTEQRKARPELPILTRSAPHKSLLESHTHPFHFPLDQPILNRFIFCFFIPY